MKATKNIKKDEAATINEIRKDEHNYIFPKAVAKMMKKVDMRTQYEASMMSTTFMMLGLVVTAVYLSIYIDFKLWYKIFLDVNFFFGLMMMTGQLITSYQQYQSYMAAQDFQKELKNKSLEQIEGVSETKTDLDKADEMISNLNLHDMKGGYKE